MASARQRWKASFASRSPRHQNTSLQRPTAGVSGVCDTERYSTRGERTKARSCARCRCARARRTAPPAWCGVSKPPGASCSAHAAARLQRVRLVLQHERVRDDKASLRLQRLDRLCKLPLERQQVLLRRGVRSAPPDARRTNACRRVPRPPSSPHSRGSPPRRQSAPGRPRIAPRSARPGPWARKRRGAGYARRAPARLPQRFRASGHCVAGECAARQPRQRPLVHSAAAGAQRRRT